MFRREVSYLWLKSHRNCQIFVTDFNFKFDAIQIPETLRKFIFQLNYNHDTSLCDTPPLEDTPMYDTPDELWYSATLLDN